MGKDCVDEEDDGEEMGKDNCCVAEADDGEEMRKIGGCSVAEKDDGEEMGKIVYSCFTFHFIHPFLSINSFHFIDSFIHFTLLI